MAHQQNLPSETAAPPIVVVDEDPSRKGQSLRIAKSTFYWTETGEEWRGKGGSGLQVNRMPQGVEPFTHFECKQLLEKVIKYNPSRSRA